MDVTLCFFIVRSSKITPLEWIISGLATIMSVRTVYLKKFKFSCNHLRITLPSFINHRSTIVCSNITLSNMKWINSLVSFNVLDFMIFCQRIHILSCWYLHVWYLHKNRIEDYKLPYYIMWKYIFYVKMLCIFVDSYAVQTLRLCELTFVQLLTYSTSFYSKILSLSKILLFMCELVYIAPSYIWTLFIEKQSNQNLHKFHVGWLSKTLDIEISEILLLGMLNVPNKL